MSTPIEVYDRADVVLVAGATGQQGGATARALLESGARVRAFTRDPESVAAKTLTANGVDVRTADLDDAASLRTALDGVQRVFAMDTMSGDTELDVRRGRRFVDAVQASGVKHVVYSSVGGAERHTGVPHFESKRRVEEHIERLGLPATFLRPVFFMENLVGSMGADGEAVVRLPIPDDVPLQMVAVEDIGKAAAAVLLDPSRAPGAVELGGDELTGSQIAAAIGAQIGGPVRYEALPTSVLAGDQDAKTMFEWFATPGAYQADWDATKRLVPDVKSLADWLDHVDFTG